MVIIGEGRKPLEETINKERKAHNERLKELDLLGIWRDIVKTYRTGHKKAVIKKKTKDTEETADYKKVKKLYDEEVLRQLQVKDPKAITAKRQYTSRAKPKEQHKTTIKANERINALLEEQARINAANVAKKRKKKTTKPKPVTQDGAGYKLGGEGLRLVGQRASRRPIIDFD